MNEDIGGLFEECRESAKLSISDEPGTKPKQEVKISMAISIEPLTRGLIPAYLDFF